VGVYPDVTLSDARSKRENEKRVLSAGGDPGQEKQAEKQARVLAVQNSFESVAIEWHEHKKPNWSPNVRKRLPLTRASRIKSTNQLWFIASGVASRAGLLTGKRCQII